MRSDIISISITHRKVHFTCTQRINLTYQLEIISGLYLNEKNKNGNTYL